MAETAIAAPAPSYSGGRSSSGVKVALGLGIAAALGYGYYRYWYLPEKLREQIALQAASRGMTPQNYLQTLGQAACVGYGASIGLPPQASGGICSELASAAIGVLNSVPGIVSGVTQAAAGGVAALGAGVGSAVGSIGSGVGGGVAAVGSGVGSGIKSIAGGAVSGATTVALAPVTITKAVVSNIGKALGFGSSKVCRSGNNKDVFPNDMGMCKARYGITDCYECGMLYNLQTRKWPWQ